MSFALLAATGPRVGEALALDRDSADLDAGVLLISRGKGRDPRLLPLHPTANAAFERYAHWRDDQHHGRRPAFFTDADGERLKYATVRDNWGTLLLPHDYARPRGSHGCTTCGICSR